MGGVLKDVDGDCERNVRCGVYEGERKAKDIVDQGMRTATLASLLDFVTFQSVSGFCTVYSSV